MEPPRPMHLRSPAFHRAAHQDPCTLASSSIFEGNQSGNYETPINSMERLKKCNETSFLHKKGTTLVCFYCFPFEKNHKTYSMFIDDAGKKNASHLGMMKF